ncbi:DUF1778 domain-containing protein [Chlorobium sp.]|uniref:type II toxin-antitoxin system TacA family antitoxin n=1 Tax=Chlorobium sp. TaxID=1095 RepID=UPI0025B986DA|nr:DUF1778 domain-containing protein [Chlorobium sp.]
MLITLFRGSPKNYTIYLHLLNISSERLAYVLRFVYSGKLPYKTRAIMKTNVKEQGKTATPKSSDTGTRQSKSMSGAAKTNKSVGTLKSAARKDAKQSSESKARLEARISRATHTRIKLASDIQGRTVTDFVVHAALEAATKTIEENFVVQLSMEGQEAFAEALLNPPEPNDALRRAFERHSALTGKND